MPQQVQRCVALRVGISSVSVVAKEDTKQDSVSVVNSGSAREKVPHGEEDGNSCDRTMHVGFVRRRTTPSPSW